MFLASARRRSPGSPAGRVGVALTLVFAMALAACGNDPSAASPKGTTNDGTATDAGGLHFEAPDVLTAAPATSVTVILDAAVDGQISLGLDGDYGDGSLEAASVTAQGGTATVVVRTPSMATTFRVHAQSQSGATANLAIAVSASGFISLGIQPTYAGVRASGAVVASAFVNTTCQALAAEPLQDGSISATGVAGTQLELTDVPAGAEVAVSARIGHYASGCIDAGILATGNTQVLALPIYDLPLVLSATDLVVTLTTTATTDGTAYWKGVMDRGRQSAEAAFVNNEAESVALLDGMAALVAPTDAGSFAEARIQYGWNSLTLSWFGAHAPGLSALVDTYLTAAEARGGGPILFGLGPVSSGNSTVSPTTVAGVPALAAGWLAPAPFGVTADAQDDVHVVGGFLVQASATLTALAAPGSFPPASGDVPAALSTSIDCTGLGAALVGSQTTSYGSCDTACTAALCTAAIGAMWTRAGGASLAASDITQVSVTASGLATVGDAAQPLGFSGNWAGQVYNASIGTGSLAGTVTATTPD